MKRRVSSACRGRKQAYMCIFKEQKRRDSAERKGRGERRKSSEKGNIREGRKEKGDERRRRWEVGGKGGGERGGKRGERR